MRVLKRSGKYENIKFDKITTRIRSITKTLGLNIDPIPISQTVVHYLYENITTCEIDEITARILMSSSTDVPEYQDIAAHITISNLHKRVPRTFLEKATLLFNAGIMDKTVYTVIVDNIDKIISIMDYKRDYLFDYFGIKTLERGYLIKIKNDIIESPQDMFMRISLAMYSDNIQEAFISYNALSQKLFTHSSPSLYNLGTKRPQGSSCFLNNIGDNIQDIFKCITDSAFISKWSGGLGISISDVRSRGAPIKGTNGISDGIVPMLKVFNSVMKYINQGGGKRPGSAAFYLEPHHPDILEFLDIRKNTGDEDFRARDIFTALWLSDLFMERVRDDELWSLFDSSKCPDLTNLVGANYKTKYEHYESQGMYERQCPAREIWQAIITAQIETGTPYMLSKDACNELSNQQNIGTIKGSNLCVEIIEYTSPEEIAVCTLASICLPRCVINGVFDYEFLGTIVKQVVRNLNKVIDINYYPVKEAETSNMRHRPLGIGMQGLSDVYLKLGYAFDSKEARLVNRKIIETMYYHALVESNELAIINGHYSSFKGSPLSMGKFNFDLFSERTDKPVELLCNYDFDGLRTKIQEFGVYNSLLLALMPTASTSQIMGHTESFEPITANIYTRKTLAGDFVVINRFLVDDLRKLKLWTPDLKDKIVSSDGSVQHLQEIPEPIRKKYKTVWELKQKELIDQSADRTPFVCQSQSLNLYFGTPNYNTIHLALMYAWKRSLKTLSYYTRTLSIGSSMKATVADCESCSG